MPDRPSGRPVEVKICGLVRREDALLAERIGAAYVGVVLTDGFGRSVTPERAADVLDGVRIGRVAVVVDEPPERAARLATAIGATVIQLHGDESPDEVRALRQLGSWKLWKAFRVRTEEDVVRALNDYRGAADAMLFEGWKDGVVGGGGVRVPLDGRLFRGHVPREQPFVLAGGLTPDNVGDAVRAFDPDVVDVSSGVESRPGEKDERLVAAFITAASSVARVRRHSPGGT